MEIPLSNAPHHRSCRVDILRHRCEVAAMRLLWTWTGAELHVVRSVGPVRRGRRACENSFLEDLLGRRSRPQPPSVMIAMASAGNSAISTLVKAM